MRGRGMDPLWLMVTHVRDPRRCVFPQLPRRWELACPRGAQDGEEGRRDYDEAT